MNNLIWSGTQTVTVIEKKEKNIQVIRTNGDFHRIANTYVNVDLNDQNFDEGQVVLVDDGEVDSCAVHLEFNSNISALELTDNTVKVTINYVERPALDKCSSAFSRPFYFYYLKTKKLLVFEEKIVQ
jgi:hypothetical protein